MSDMKREADLGDISGQGFFDQGGDMDFGDFDFNNPELDNPEKILELEREFKLQKEQERKKISLLRETDFF